MFKTVNKKFKSPEHRIIKEFGTQLAETGVNFFVYNDAMDVVEFCGCGEFVSNTEHVLAFAKDILAGESESVQVQRCMVAAKSGGCGGTGTEVLLADLGTEVPGQRGCVRLLLSNFIKSLNDDRKNRRQIELISGELAQTYEELMMLYKLSSSMKVTRSDSNYLQIACDNLTELVKVEGIAIFIEKRIGYVKKLVLTAGKGLLGIDHKDEAEQGILYERLQTENSAGFDVLLDSDIDSPFKYSWPGRVRNIIAVPLYSGEKITGMMVATNRLGRPDFDSIDAKLFNSVANECAVFIENNRLFGDLKELFIGALRALTNSIDAKDQYTRGHSERVAFISRWIAEHYAQSHPMDSEDIQKIYLAGLLHDIGKIGIAESVLSKDGRLTEQEFAQIKTHPTIGAGILSEIKQMRDIIPGVLCHHERYDGTGYPNGLCGDDIPPAGKIVMIADTFDAMTSRRTYRNALSLRKTIDEIKTGLGGQFDPETGRIFIESDIEKLWEILQTGRFDEYYSDNLNDYGTVAVGALLR